MDASFLDQELRAAENSCAVLEEQNHERKRALDVRANTDDNEEGTESRLTVFERLLSLQTTTDSIALAQDYLRLIKSSPRTLSNNTEDNIYDNDFETLLMYAQFYFDFSEQVVLRHADVILDLCPALYEEGYIPCFDFLHAHFVILLRQELQSSRYPSAKGCGELLGGENGAAYLATICQYLSRLEGTHEKVLHSVEGVDTAHSKDSVLLELFHPLLDRVYFHFINTAVDDDDPSRDNHASLMTTTRQDRLPEWLLNYIKENFLQDDGPYQVIRSVMGPSSALPFSRELIRLIQWVLVEKRNFFDDPAISGPQSNPQLLYQAVEQFLEFDTMLIDLVADTKITNDTITDTSEITIQSKSNEHFSGLMDTLIVSNEEMLDWWIQRERESLSSTLFPEDDSIYNEASRAPLANCISPRAELFCSLIRSVQLKASTLTAPGIYLREVAVPLCSQFVDALHETSVDLRNRLIQKHDRRQCVEQHRNGSIDLEKRRIVSNIHDWVEIINGTQLASQILLSNERLVSRESDHDLGRFGRSLERLAEVMIEEFAATFVETTLLEQSKFANYLMLASHLLASPERVNEDMMAKENLTAELSDAKIVLQYLQDTCDSITNPRQLLDQDQGDEEERFSSYAPLGMRARVANRLVEKLLDVALDTNHITPDIWLKGATVFARDMNFLLESFCDIPAVNQLFEITNFMTMDYDSFCGLFAAIGALIDSSTYLDIEELNSDKTLCDEASSMLKAKDINCPLGHAVSIMNRRRG